MKNFIFLMLFVVANNAFSQKLHLCFTSTDSAYAEDPIQVSFNVIDKDWANGFVQYKGQKDGYLLSFSVEKTIEKKEGDVPQIEYSFNEIKNGKTTGKYFIALKGPKVMYFYYYNKQRKSRINFAQDYSSENQCSCEW